MWTAVITEQVAQEPQDQISIVARYYDEADPSSTVAWYMRAWPTTTSASEIQADIVAYGQAQRAVRERIAALPNYVGVTIAVP
jgi:predicted component of type VI protein secretion system